MFGVEWLVVVLVGDEYGVVVGGIGDCGFWYV